VGVSVFNSLITVCHCQCTYWRPEMMNKCVLIICQQSQNHETLHNQLPLS